MSEEVYTNCTNAGPVSVYVKDGKIVRIRPLAAAEGDFKPWTIEANGHKYTPERKFNLAPYIHAERDRVYSQDRIRYPMKRKDFDPNGARNPQNRGKSPYQRIGWDEALDMVGAEIRRVREDLWTFGPLRDDLLSPQLGRRGLQNGPLLPFSQHARLHAGFRQPG